MKAIRAIVALVLVATISAVIVAKNHSHGSRSNPAPAVAEQPAAPPDSTPAVSEMETPIARAPVEPIVSALRFENIPPSTNKLERLNQIRQMFHALARGDQVAAMRAAKQITNEVERETALLTLVTEWTHGELDSPQRRAHWIDTYGLEVGLGLELASQPELALAWANELTDGSGRTDLLQAIARGLTTSDPNAAFALNDQVSEPDRRKFFDSLLGNWASHDTAAALQWAEQIADPTDRDAATQTIRAVAPTGIGAAVMMQDGHPIIKELVPGTPAAVSGQLFPGDRVLAIAQGNNMFVNAQNLPIADVIQMIRGAAGSPVQLQVLAADAPPNSLPRTITLYRDQIKFKN